MAGIAGILVALIFLFICFNFVQLWIQAYLAGARIGFLDMLRMQLLKLDYATIVKVVGFVASDPGFTGQPAVINGASELLGTAFGDKGSHARSAVGVAALPLDAPVEVEVTVSVTD